MPRVGELRPGVPIPADLVRARRAKRKAAGVPWYPHGIAACRRKKRHGGEGTAEAEAERLEIVSPHLRVQPLQVSVLRGLARGPGEGGSVMSADNWRQCPRCLKKAAEEHDKDLVRFQEAYGKVPVGEYERLRAKAEKEPEVEHHLREDYEIWMTDEGEFNVRYRGDCQDCPYVFVFQHTIQSEV